MDWQELENMRDGCPTHGTSALQTKTRDLRGWVCTGGEDRILTPCHPPIVGCIYMEDGSGLRCGRAWCEQHHPPGG
jgi:hypothetical protein